MTIRFGLDVEDNFAFQKYYKESIETNSTVYYSIGNIIFLVIIAIVVWDESPLSSIIFSILAIVIFFLKFNGLNSRWEGYVHKILSENENKGLLGQREYTIDETGIRVIEREGEKDVYIAWTGFVKTANTENYIFLYTSGLSAEIFPLQKLQQNEVEELRSLLDKYVPTKQN